MLNSKVTKIPCTLRLAVCLCYNYSWSPSRYNMNRNSTGIKTDPPHHTFSKPEQHQPIKVIFFEKKNPTSLWNTPSDKILIPHHLTTMNLTGRILCSSQRFLVWSLPEETMRRRHCCGEYYKNASDKQFYKYCVQGTRGAELLWLLKPKSCCGCKNCLCKQFSR